MDFQMGFKGKFLWLRISSQNKMVTRTQENDTLILKNEVINLELTNKNIIFLLNLGANSQNFKIPS